MTSMKLYYDFCGGHSKLEAGRPPRSKKADLSGPKPGQSQCKLPAGHGGRLLANII